MKMKMLSSDIEAVIFDLDGTLADSMWMWADIDREYLSRFALEEKPELMGEIAGMNMVETAVFFKKHFHIPDSIDKIIADWIDMSLDKYKHEVSLKPYAAELLKFLKANGIKTAIASSNAIEMIRACLKSNGVEDMFDAVVSASEVEHGKPAPDVYLLAAERIGAEPAKCLVFEDIPAGLRAGKAAGMKTIGVSDKYSEGSEIEMRAEADRYYPGFKEFLEAEGVIA